MSEQSATLKEVVTLVLKLSPSERARLMEQLDEMLERDLVQQEKKPLRSLYGLWADLDVNISAEDIDEIRRDMWANFPRGDIA